VLAPAEALLFGRMPNMRRKAAPPTMQTAIAISGETKNEIATAMMRIRAKTMGRGTQGGSS
jgi:hypothetical protein